MLNRHSQIHVLVLAAALPMSQTLGRPPEIGQARLTTEKSTALRAAIADLTATFSDEYPRGEEFLKRLDRIERRIKMSENTDIAHVEVELIQLQREVLLANPLVSRYPILFVVRTQYRSDHHNTATMFQTGEINTGSFQGGSAMKTIDLANSGQIATLVESHQGVVRDPEIHFDGKKVIFAMRNNIDDDYHIYEINTDGANLRQLTLAPRVADIDPLYLPDGSIIFSSTREPKYCMCNRHIMCNLFRMDADGANIHQIGKNTLHEGHAALMTDGRIVYDRWEYVDRNFGDAQGLWTVNPDGTNHAVYWGNNTWSPGAVIDARAVPATESAICVFSSCHDRPWGALAVIDRRLGVDGRESVLHTWPADAIRLVRKDGPRAGAYGFDNFKQVNPKYEDPYPLSDKYFLCSRTTGKGEQMGIYLVDVFGNEILLHVEEPGCYDPMPFGPRPRPPAIPARRNFRGRRGYLYVINVYEGTHMERVKSGAAKYIRVVESPEKRFWTHTAWGGQGVHCPAMNWHSFENKRVLGLAPVEADGSAYFEVPSDRFIYFQPLDENKMMIQSMRSGTTVQCGELTGCIGCHEGRRKAAPQALKNVPIALRRAPSKLQGWKGKSQLFSYMAEVQPVFDRHCVRCHDYGKEAGTKLNLTADRTNTFNTSYHELWRKKYITAIGAGPADIQPPYSWGSHASKLVHVVQQGHNDVHLSKAEFETIVTWIDLNAPYYPCYDSAYPDNLAGRSPLNNNQLKRLSELTGVPFAKLANHSANQSPQISFDRPQLSPCLAKFKDPNDPDYLEALKIVQAGELMLLRLPRADMQGFKACAIDQRRQEWYAARQQVEFRNRQAIQYGERVYDTHGR